MTESAAKRISMTRSSVPSTSGVVAAGLRQAAASPRPRRFRLQERNLLIGSAAVALIFAVALFAPFVAPYGPQDTDYTARLRAPSPAHLFGTDNLGRDILSRVVWGAQIDLQVGVLSILFPLVLGTCLGCLTGYFGGLTDGVIMRV